MKAEPAPIMLDTLIAELENLEVAHEELSGQTTSELAQAWKMSLRQADVIIRAAHRAGVLRVGRAKRTNRIGALRSEPIYWFEFPAKAKGKKK